MASILPVISSSSRPVIKPTREQILAYRSSFQGAYVKTSLSDIPLPWWETIAWLLNPNDRKTAFNVKRQRNDRHCVVDLTGAYLEPGQIYYDLGLGIDYTKNDNSLSALRRITEEALNNGYWIDFRLGMDGLSVNNNPQFGEYNDQQGKTYGWQWGMKNFERVFRKFEDLNDYIIWCPGYDGVFYGWDDDKMTAAERVMEFGSLARNLGVKYLGLEFNTGHIPLGEGEGDYSATGRMKDYDIIYGEFDPFVYHSDSTWQILGRCIRPYVRPPDQTGDPNPPFYLAQDSARGPFAFSAFEILTYRWVRFGVSDTELNDCKNYFLSMNGNGNSLNLCM